MGLLSREIVRRVAPLVAMGAAGAAGAVVAQRRLAQRRKLSLQPGPPSRSAATGPVPPGPQPTPPNPTPPSPAPPPAPPSPTPDPIPAPTPAPEPELPTPPPEPVPQPGITGPEPGIAIAGGTSQGPESAADVVTEPSPRERILEESVREALVNAAPEGAGAVEVEVAGSMVVLRGRVDSREAIRDLERAAANVPGVEGVRVLLHLPGRAARRSAGRSA